jgi:glucosamine-6-phosphate deaminase
MARKYSSIAPEWWDYTTLDPDLIEAAARLTPVGILELSRPGFKVVFYDSLEDFYLAEALEYVAAWKQSTDDNPVGVCGPIGPTEHLPLVARIVNELELKLHSAHFWGMDEWLVDGKEIASTHPISFEHADRKLCFSRIGEELRMPDTNLHFPKADTAAYRKSWDCGVRCLVMQGGQGDVKHWAFNDPPRRTEEFIDVPPLHLLTFDNLALGLWIFIL